jgi:hypothetical protein
VLEASVLSGLKTHLMHPDLLCEFIAEYHRELNRLNSEREQSYARQKENLVAELNRPERRDEASEALCGLISKILLIPENGKLAIELAGDLAGILALASDSKKPVSQRDGLSQVTLVAGVRNHLYRTVFVVRRHRPLATGTSIRIRKVEIQSIS